MLRNSFANPFSLQEKIIEDRALLEETAMGVVGGETGMSGNGKSPIGTGYGLPLDSETLAWNFEMLHRV